MSKWFCMGEPYFEISSADFELLLEGEIEQCRERMAAGRVRVEDYR